MVSRFMAMGAPIMKLKMGGSGVQALSSCRPFLTQYMCWPPFIDTLLPVMNPASLAMNAPVRRFPQAVPDGPREYRQSIAATSRHARHHLRIQIPRRDGVDRSTPLRATSCARALVKPCMPAFAAE